jgi:hypothetical protein
VLFHQRKRPRFTSYKTIGKIYIISNFNNLESIWDDNFYMHNNRHFLPRCEPSFYFLLVSENVSLKTNNVDEVETIRKDVNNSC